MNIFEWIIRNRKFAALILAFGATLWFLNRLLLSDDFSGTVMFLVLSIWKYILAFIMLLPAGFTQLLLWQGPFVVTPGNVWFLVALFAIANVAVFGAVAYFAYQFLTFRGKYGKTLGKTFMEFLQSHASMSDLFSRTADFAANNKFYSVVVFAFLFVLILGGMLPKSQYFVFVNNTEDGVSFGKVTKESFEAWEKSPETVKTLNISVEGDGTATTRSFPVEKSDFRTVGGLLEFVVPRTLKAVFPKQADVDKAKSATMGIMAAEPYAAMFSTGITAIVNEKYSGTFSGSGKFVTDGAAGPEVGKIYKAGQSDYTFYPDYITDRVHYEAVSGIPNGSLRSMAYLFSVYSRQRYLTHYSEMEDEVTKAAYNKKLASLASFSASDGGMASTFNQLLAVAILLLFGMFNRILVVGLMIRRIFTGKDMEFSDGTKMKFGDVTLRSVGDDGEFSESDTEAAERMESLKNEKNTVGTLDETAGIAAEVEKLGLAAVLGNIDAWKMLESTFDPLEYARQKLAEEAEMEINDAIADRMDEESRARDEEIGKVYRSEMDNFLVYSDSDTEEEREIKREYFDKKAELEKGNAEKSSIEELRNRYVTRMETEKKRENIQKELADMDARKISLSKLISEETDPDTRQKFVDELEKLEKDRESKYTELLDVTDYSDALDMKKEESRAEFEKNNENARELMEKWKAETDIAKKEEIVARMTELKEENARISEILWIENLRDAHRSLLSDEEKIEKKISLQEEERGYERELKTLKELKEEKKARGDDVTGIENEIEKVRSKIGNVRESILQISDENDGNVLNEAREALKKFRDHHEHEKLLVEKREEIKATKKESSTEHESLSIKNGDITILRKKIEDTKRLIASEKNLQKKQVLMLERKQMEEELKQFEYDRDKMQSNLEALNKKVLELNNDEIGLFKKFKDSEVQMSRSKEDGWFGLWDPSTWPEQEKEWKTREDVIKEKIRSKFTGKHADEIRKKLTVTSGIIAKAAMDDAVTNQLRLREKTTEIEDKLAEKEDLIMEHADGIRNAERKVLETIWKRDTSEKREEVDRRVSDAISEKQENFGEYARKLRETKLSKDSIETKASEIFEASKASLREKAAAAASAEELQRTQKMLQKKLSEEQDERIKRTMEKELEIIANELADKLAEAEGYSEDAKSAVTEEIAAVETLKKKIRLFGGDVNGRAAANELEVLKKKIIDSDKALMTEYRASSQEYERMKKVVESLPDGTKEKEEAEARLRAHVNDINANGYAERHAAYIRALELAKEK